MKKGSHHTKESKEKLKQGTLNYFELHPEARERARQDTLKYFELHPEKKIKISKFHTGRKHTVEAKKLIGLASLGNKYRLGFKLSEKHKKIISDSNRGKIVSKKTIEKILKSREGYKTSEITKKKQSIVKLFGNYIPTDEEYLKLIKERSKIKMVINEERRSFPYKFWVRECKNRDSWKCKISNKDCDGRLEVHHILGFKEHPELRYDINNGITLCHFHHPRKRKDEVKFSPYFKELISLSKNNE